MLSSREKLRPALVAIVVIAIGVAAGGCASTPPGGESGPTSEVVVTSDIGECPHTWTWEARDNQESRDTIEQQIASVTRGAHHVPAYNDCQKFVIEQAGQHVYSAGQFAIFAVQDSDLIGMLNEGVRVAAAVIFAEEAYAPMGIEKDFNCLVLSVSGERWSAWMYPPQNGGIADCSGKFPEKGGHPLTVEPPVSPLPAQEGHYAQLARWGYDRDRGLHYSTVTCGEAVCHVGPTSGFTVTFARTPNADSATAMERRVHELAPWHDQQLLAAFDIGTNSLRPTDVWGTVFPDPGLGDRNTLDDFNEWVTVAEVELSANHPDYTAKGFRMTTPGDVRNIVQSCVIITNARGEVMRNQCLDLPAEFLPGRGKCDASDKATPGESWRSRHIPVDGDIKYFCVKRYPLNVEGLEVPATARWRWRADDELLWYRCKFGCCDEQV